ncbi:MAG TPA: hypothetical protein VJ751_12340 [Pyrinomonadaceae bacterium]|nr:hypothetical protein [Pyrinomonadaceae bacterium]
MLILLGVLMFVYHLGRGIYFARGLEPLPTVEFLYTAGFICGVVWWLRADAKSSAVTRTYCDGLLVGIGWIFIIPYHLFKTRGVKGLIPLFALILTFIASYVLAAIVSLLLSDGIIAVAG